MTIDIKIEEIPVCLEIKQEIELKNNVHNSTTSRSFSITPIELTKGHPGHHMKANTREKPYQCTHCESIFTEA